jgi:hypothetical protein
MGFESDDFLWQSYSPTQQVEETPRYFYRLKIDGDIFNTEYDTYEEAIDDLKLLIKIGEQFDKCVIEKCSEITDPENEFIFEKNVYIQKVCRFIELTSPQWELSSDEQVEKNKLRNYLNFGL